MGAKLIPSSPATISLNDPSMASLFTDNFPTFSTQEELNQLIVKYPTYDPYYVVSGSMPDRRERFDHLYKQYYPYADSNFLTEVKRQFHQRTWEMYLGCILLEHNILISSKDYGPDFLIEKNGAEIWIECIACTTGFGDDKVPPLVHGVVQYVQDDKMSIRLVGALEEKFKKYQKYLNKKVVSDDDAFIIAVNAGALGRPDGAIPLILKCLFAIGHPTISFPIGGGETEHDWSRREYIEKSNNNKVPMNFFLKEEHAGITGNIFF